MNVFKSSLVLCALLTIGLPSVEAQIIDTFENDYSPETIEADGTATSTQSNPGDGLTGVLGGADVTRTATVAAVSAADNSIESEIGGALPNTVSFDNGILNQGTLEITYDGFGAGNELNLSNSTLPIFVIQYNEGSGDTSVNITIELTSAGGSASETEIILGTTTNQNLNFLDNLTEFGAFDIGNVTSVTIRVEPQGEGSDILLFGEDDPFEVQQIPEPTSLAIWGLACGSAVWYTRRRRKLSKQAQ